MPSDETRQTYRFRWVNINLDEFRAQRQFIADDLRRKAEAMNKAAEVIEAEIRAWVDALEEAPMPDPMTPARRDARQTSLMKMLEDHERGMATALADLNGIHHSEIKHLRADLWVPTPAGLAAARAAKEDEG
jgi:hypothetical protein